MANVAHSTLTTTDLHPPGRMQASSPGAIGAGNFWVDTTLGTGKYLLKVRNAGNSAYESLSFNAASPPAIGSTTPAAATFSLLTVTATGGAFSVLDSPAGNSRQLIFKTSNVDRWKLSTNSTSESGSNVGSDLIIQRFNDAGSSLGTPLTITRSTGAVALSGALTIGGALDHDGSTVGLYGVTPAARATGYTTFTNLSTDRTCDANAVVIAELADIVGTLIEDLKLTGIIGA